MEIRAYGCTRDLLSDVIGAHRLNTYCNGSGNDSYSAAEQGAVALPFFFMAPAGKRSRLCLVGVAIGDGALLHAGAQGLLM